MKSNRFGQLWRISSLPIFWLTTRAAYSIRYISPLRYAGCLIKILWQLNMKIHKDKLPFEICEILRKSLDFNKEAGCENSSYLYLDMSFIKLRNWEFATIYENQILDLDTIEDGIKSRDATNLFNAINTIRYKYIVIVECSKLFQENQTEAYFLSNIISSSDIESFKYVENSYGFLDYVLIFSYPMIDFLILLPDLSANLFIAGTKHFLKIACADNGWNFNNLS